MLSKHADKGEDNSLLLAMPAHMVTNWFCLQYIQFLRGRTLPLHILCGQIGALSYGLKRDPLLFAINLQQQTHVLGNMIVSGFLFL